MRGCFLPMAFQWGPGRAAWLVRAGPPHGRRRTRRAEGPAAPARRLSGSLRSSRLRGAGRGVNPSASPFLPALLPPRAEIRHRDGDGAALLGSGAGVRAVPGGRSAAAWPCRGPAERCPPATCHASRRAGRRAAPSGSSSFTSRRCAGQPGRSSPTEGKVGKTRAERAEREGGMEEGGRGGLRLFPRWAALLRVCCFSGFTQAGEAEMRRAPAPPWFCRRCAVAERELWALPVRCCRGCRETLN